MFTRPLLFYLIIQPSYSSNVNKENFTKKSEYELHEHLLFKEAQTKSEGSSSGEVYSQLNVIMRIDRPVPSVSTLLFTLVLFDGLVNDDLTGHYGYLTEHLRPHTWQHVLNVGSRGPWRFCMIRIRGVHRHVLWHVVPAHLLRRTPTDIQCMYHGVKPRTAYCWRALKPTPHFATLLVWQAARFLDVERRIPPVHHLFVLFWYVDTALLCVHTAT